MDAATHIHIAALAVRQDDEFAMAAENQSTKADIVAVEDFYIGR